jgi:hypothetical protein
MEKYKIYHHSLLRRSSIDHVVRHVSTGRAKVVLRPQMASLPAEARMLPEFSSP